MDVLVEVGRVVDMRVGVRVDVDATFIPTFGLDTPVVCGLGVLVEVG